MSTTSVLATPTILKGAGPGGEVEVEVEVEMEMENDEEEAWSLFWTLEFAAVVIGKVEYL